MSTVLGPLEWVVSTILVLFHGLFAPVLGADSGWAWALAIVGLVVVIRIALIPLFVKQIRAQRGLQLLQPEIKKIQQKYKNDRNAQSQELMKLYKETGTNPLASCLPILLQMPIFFALFRVLDGIAKGETKPGFPAELVNDAQTATILGAQISESFLGAEGTAAKIVSVVLIVLMSASTFMTQKQLMSKNMPAAAMEGQFAQQQKILLYVFPVVFAVTGINFPIGVLLYWLTTNVWSMGQQFYVIHKMPAPGSIAAENLERKRAQRAARKSGSPGGGGAADGSGSGTTAGGSTQVSDPTRGSGQRQQPKRQTRDKRRRPPRGGGSGDRGQGPGGTAAAS